ncbi:MAG: thioredoxin family protein [Bacilli bacterium]|jgi:thioredoxin 1|nr:thioredoxin family protein [Bacilli bacterium]
MIQHIDKAIDFDKAIANPKALVDFFATWCGPCSMLSPVVEKVAADHPELTVIKVDVDQAPELAARYGVYSIPALFYIEDGKLVDKRVGYIDERSVKAFCRLK